MNNDKVIKAYNEKLTEIKDITDNNIIYIKRKIDDLTVQLTIAIKLGHGFEEHLIRSNLEKYIKFSDMLNKYDFNIIKK